MNIERGPELSGEHVMKAHEENATKHAEAMGWTTEAHGEANEKKADKEEALAQAERDENSEQKHVKQLAKSQLGYFRHALIGGKREE